MSAVASSRMDAEGPHGWPPRTPCPFFRGTGGTLHSIIGACGVCSDGRQNLLSVAEYRGLCGTQAWVRCPAVLNRFEEAAEDVSPLTSWFSA
jgi:hypothetical protein